MALENAAEVPQIPEFETPILSVDSIVGLFGRMEVQDSDYPAEATDSYVGYATLTATRQVILPPAAGFPAGKAFVVADESGQCSQAVQIKIAGSGTDTIAGQQTIVMGAPYQKLTFHSNGKNLWVFN